MKRHLVKGSNLKRPNKRLTHLVLLEQMQMLKLNTKGKVLPINSLGN